MDLFRIKPLDSDRIADVIYKYDKIVVVEEHSYIGGLGNVISHLMVTHGFFKPMKHISLPDEFCKKYGDRNWIKKQYGLDSDNISKIVLEWYRRP